MAKEPKNKFSSSGQFILMVGDEGAVLTQLRGGAVIRRLFAQSPEPAHAKGINEALAASPQSPVTILFDVMDQSYVRQTLPPVSSFSVSKIITRRLNKDFSPDDIKGYVILDREKTGRKDWNFLMVSLANSPLMQKWITFAAERENPLKGMGLLPLEAQRFMQAVSKSLLKSHDKTAKPLEWQILVSHHKVGGCRQIVMRDGKLAFTRMAQPFGDSTPAVIAGNIEQEIINTIEYLKRLGLQDHMQTAITIICSDEIKSSLDKNNLKAGEHHFFSPYEITSLLSLKDAAQQGDSFGDVVISAFIGKQRKLLLSLQTPYTQKLAQFALGIKAVKAAGALGVLAIIGWIGMSTYGILDAHQNSDSLEAKHRTLTDDLAKIKTRAETLPKNINLYSDIMKLSQMLNKDEYELLPFIGKTSEVLQGFGLLSTFTWSESDPLTVSKGTDKRIIKMDAELHINMENITQMQQLVEQVQSFTGRMQKTFPAYKITYSDLPGIVSDTKDIKIGLNDELNLNGGAVDPKNSTIKFEMSGPVDNTKNKASGR